MREFSSCLILYEVDLPYLHFHCDEIRRYFKKSISLNYSDFFEKNGIYALQQKILDLIVGNDVDVIMIFNFEDDYELSPDFLRSLRDRCRLVFWLFDDEILLHAHSKFYAQTADVVVTTDYFGRSYYESIGIPTVLYFSSYSKKDYFPKQMERIYDVSFIGDVGESRRSRRDFIRVLEENGVRVAVFGANSERGFVSHREMIDIFNKSKINLNFTAVSMLPGIYRFDPLFIARSKQNKGRPIEIALTRSFCLSEYAPSLPFVFKIGEEIDTFRNSDELLSKVRYYLDNEGERVRLSENAYRRAIREYESDVYIRKVFDELFGKLTEIEKYRVANMTVFESGFFRQRRLFFYTRSIRRALKSLRVGSALQLFSYLLKQGYSPVRITYTFFLELFGIRTTGSLR